MRVTAVLAMVCAFALGGKAMAEELKVGDKAPNFELQASDGKTYKLSDFAGKQAVVLAWFPAAFTQGCTIECKSLAEHADFPLLSDPTKKTAEAYGVLNAKGFASRWTFYIDKSGNIAYIDKAVKPATSAEDMAAKLGELKVAAKK